MYPPFCGFSISSSDMLSWINNGMIAPDNAYTNHTNDGLRLFFNSEAYTFPATMDAYGCQFK